MGQGDSLLFEEGKDGKRRKKSYLATIALLGLLLIVGGVVITMVLREGSSGGVEIMEVESFDEAQDKEIFVDVAGAVIKPGMYRFEIGARINDALVKAGGLALEADRDWVSKNLNLALKLSDGVKLYIPYEGTTLRQGYEDQGSVAGTSITGKINVNSASISELDTLWGVGEATAKKIIEGRPYGSKEELLTKKVVKTNVYEEIKDEVVVY
jgi:competence protein ComEA